MPDIVILGEALMDIFADKGVPLRAAKTMHVSPGGAPANVAVALARLGADVGFIGRVGVDDFGALLIDLLSAEGVDTTHFKADPRGPTMLGVVAVPSPTEQQFILYNGANSWLLPEELPQDYILSAAVFGFGSVTLASESRSAAIRAARWAREAGNHVVFDVNLRPLLWPDLEIARQRIEEALATSTVVKLNESELHFLTGETDPARGSRHILAGEIQLCCVSLGAGGAYFDNGRAGGYLPAIPVEVRDTTGSGDAFVAGLAYQLSQLRSPVPQLGEADLRKMIAFANVCGGLAATLDGAMSALPTLETVERTLAAQV